MADGWRSQPPPCSKGSGEGRWGTWIMGTPVPPQAHPANAQAASWIATDYVPSSSISNTYHMNYSTPPVNMTTDTIPKAIPGGVSSSGSNQNPYVQVAPVPGSYGKSPMEMILQVLDACGKKIEDTTRIAGNVWNHLKTSPSLSDATTTRLKHGTKVLAEGGRDSIYYQEFGVFPGEQLWKAYACYLSTSSGPVIGTLYLTNMKVAFCSDKPLCQYANTSQQEWVYYKVVVPLDLLIVVNPSASRTNPAEKYIELVTADGHEFWFMGFVSYDKALNNLTAALTRFQRGQHQPIPIQ